MTLQQILLIGLGPWLFLAPIVAVVAPQIPGFFGSGRRTQQFTARVRLVRLAPAWRLA